MKVASKPFNETERIADLHEYKLLDTLPEKEYDDITRIASKVCNMPISVITLIDRERQWFKSKTGLDSTETPRDISFCAHAILQPEDMFIVSDAAKDERFFDNPLVTGAPYIAFYAGVPLVSEAGNPLGTLCVMDNKPNRITIEQQDALISLGRQIVSAFELRKKNIELIAQKKELEIINQELERFAFVAAHDLRSPCGSIDSIAKMLKEEYGDKLDSNANEMLELLTFASGSIVGLIDGILQHTRIVHSSDIRKEKFIFGALITELRVLLNIPPDFTFIAENEDASLYTSGNALLQILLNLCTNAIKYNDKENGTLTIALEEQDNYYKFTVTDNGPGIKESDQVKIFDLFSTLGLTDRNNNKGHGIGLSTVKRLVEKMNGEISVSSELGKSTTFTFSIAK